MTLQLRDLRVRDNRQLTQEDLAELLDTNRSCISKTETTNRFSTIKLLESYSKEFNIPTDVLLGLMDEHYININKEAYERGKSFREMLDIIIYDYFDSINRFEDFFLNDKKNIGSDDPDLGNYLKSLDILESVKSQMHLSNIHLTLEEENILIKTLDLILVESSYKNKENLLLFLNNLDKFKDITAKIVTLNESKLKIILDILKEFN